MRRLDFLFGCVAASLAGCAPTGPVRDFAVLDDGAQPLRSRFDAAAGKVRVLMLVSPT
jgi:hypothetical protein